MAEIFNRKYSLEIGRSGKLIKTTIPGTIVRPGLPPRPSPTGYSKVLSDGTYLDFAVVPASARLFDDLQMTADVSYTKEGQGNKQGTKISLHNLSKRSINSIAKDDTVILRAGYDKDPEPLPLIFIGQVKSVKTTRQNPGKVTEILCTAAEVPKKNVKISKPPVYFETNKDIANYFARVAADNGIPTGRIFLPEEIVYTFGLPLMGSLFPVMEEWCKRNYLRCYVTLGRLYIEPIVLSQVVTKVVINEDNVKGSIEAEDEYSDTTSTTSASPPGIKFTTFLFGDITLDAIISISYGEYQGDYSITSIDHKLDYEGSNWDTVVSCKRLTNG